MSDVRMSDLDLLMYDLLMYDDRTPLLNLTFDFPSQPCLQHRYHAFFPAQEIAGDNVCAGLAYEP